METRCIRFEGYVALSTPKTLNIALCFAVADRDDAATAEGDRAVCKRTTEPVIKNGSVRDQRGREIVKVGISRTWRQEVEELKGGLGDRRRWPNTKSHCYSDGAQERRGDKPEADNSLVGTLSVGLCVGVCLQCVSVLQHCRQRGKKSLVSRQLVRCSPRLDTQIHRGRFW